MNDYLEAAIKLGLPMVFMSWWVYSWLYRRGHVDKKANRKQTEVELKALKQARKSAKKASKASASSSDAHDSVADETDSSLDDDNIWLNKWMWLGGGFYGLAALWTLIVVEVQEFIQFLGAIPEFITRFLNGPVDVLVAVLLNQIGNLVAAFTWVTYWRGGFSLVWFFAAYFGYLAGIQLAKRVDAKSALLRRINSFR